jgi:PTH2 family peptidyl-tRNA hydrolase
MYKQVIVLRRDLEISEGKKCVQSAHASLGAYEKADEEIIKKWNSEGQKKVVLEVDSEKDILELFKKAKKEKIPCFLVKDAGLTEVEPGTITALGLGPEEEEKLDKITGGLRLL